MENINPYITFTLPLVRVFYPKLVLKELTTVAPMDKPDKLHFIKTYKEIDQEMFFQMYLLITSKGLIIRSCK